MLFCDYLNEVTVLCKHTSFICKFSLRSCLRAICKIENCSVQIAFKTDFGFYMQLYVLQYTVCAHIRKEYISSTSMHVNRTDLFSFNTGRFCEERPAGLRVHAGSTSHFSYAAWARWSRQCARRGWFRPWHRMHFHNNDGKR